MVRYKRSEQRQCGGCDLCVHLFSDVFADGDDHRRSTKFACLWRRDAEGVATDEHHRPDKSGVILSESYNVATNNDGLYAWVSTPDAYKKQPWLRDLLEKLQVAFHIKIQVPGMKPQLFPKGAAVSRSGVIDFLKHKSKERGGI